MGGGGGDGGYAEKQAQIERQKQQARDALNLAFGVAPSGGTPPSRDQFTSPTGGGYYETNPNSEQGGSQVWVPGTAPQFDQAGYDKSLDAYNGQATDAAKNKAARDALYGQVRQNSFDVGKTRLDDQRQKALRDLRFTLFAQGLNGGSADVDQNALLGRTYSQGLLDLGAKADAEKTSVMNSDEQTRLGLLQSIDNGMDQGSALSSALKQMQVNGDRASAEAQGTDLGDLFANSGLLYTRSRAAQGQAAYGVQPWYASFAAPSYGRGVGGVSSGASGFKSEIGG